MRTLLPETTNDAQQIATELERRQKQNGTVDANITLIYLGLGNADEAMNWLEKAYDARFNPAILVRPEFDSLRSDARFKALMRCLGLDSRSPVHIGVSSLSRARSYCRIFTPHGKSALAGLASYG